MAMLEFDDIQHFVLTRVPAVTGRYEFLSFRQPSQGRAWLAGIIDKVASAQAVSADLERQRSWVSIAFTWSGLRALGASEASLASSPEEFRQGMVARSQVLGDTGANHPEHWIGGAARAGLHANAPLFSPAGAEGPRGAGGDPTK